MGKNYIITIGREYGSGGFEIGKKLAEKLGIGFYDKNLIDEVSKKSGIHVEMLHKADEKTASPFTNPLAHPGYEAGTVNDRLFWTQSEIIRDIADKEYQSFFPCEFLIVIHSSYAVSQSLAFCYQF